MVLLLAACAGETVRPLAPGPTPLAPRPAPTTLPPIPTLGPTSTISPQATSEPTDAIHPIPIDIDARGVQFTFPSTLANDVEWNPYPPLPTAAPTSTATPAVAAVYFRFFMYYPSKTIQLPEVSVCSVADLIAAYPEAKRNIDALSETLAGKTKLIDGSLPFLPPLPGNQQLYVQVRQVKFKNGRGIRYLTQYSASRVPINNRGAFYAFQGLTDDRRYYLSAILPVSNPLLAGDEISIPGGDRQAFEARYPQYIAETKQKLDAAPAESFKPNLSVLDVMMESFNIPGDALTPYPTPTARVIRFPPGATLKAIEGILPNEATARWVVHAQAGQILNVEIQPWSGPYALSVTGADGTVLQSEKAASTKFNGRVPATQDYNLDLHNGNMGAALYMIIVTVQ